MNSNHLLPSMILYYHLNLGTMELRTMIIVYILSILFS
jgi:hypothetical protein